VYTATYYVFLSILHLNNYLFKLLSLYTEREREGEDSVTELSPASCLDMKRILSICIGCVYVWVWLYLESFNSRYNSACQSV
jgi:hypothetical protein